MGFFSSIGGVLGGIVGNIVAPGIGTVIGSALGGAAGGAVDSNKANKTNQGYYNQQMDFAQSQYQFQQDYIKNAMQWRAEDAKKAGYHPMAALGFSSPSFSPVSAPQYSGYSDSNSIDPMEFGQSLNYASAKAKTAKQQEQAFNLTSEGMRLDNQGKQIQNEIAATELLSMQAQLRNSGPTAPQVNATNPTQDGGGMPTVYNAIDWAHNGDYYVPTLSQAAADRTDDDPWAKRVLQGGTLVEFIDNHPNSRPPYSSLSSNDRAKLKSGHYHWVVHPFGLRLDIKPGHEKFVRWTNNDGSVGGKIFQ